MLLRLGPSTRIGVVRSRAALLPVRHPIGTASALISPRCARCNTTTATETKKPKVQKKVLSFGELPTRLVDGEGNEVAPLPDLEKGPAKSRKKRQTKEATPPVIVDEDADFQAAVRAGTVPDTHLSKLVFQNWKRFPDCILLTQVGNFYESYFEPASRVASLLGIKLTSKRYKNGKFPFTGFPIHQRDKYLKILVHDLGYNVALVEEEKDEVGNQLNPEDISRKVARIVTPGTLLDEHWLTGNESRYLLAVALANHSTPKKQGKAVRKDEEEQLPLYLAYADISTGDFFTKEGTLDEIEDELARISPTEIVLDARLRDAWEEGDLATIAETPTGRLLSLLRVLGVHVSFADTAPSLEDDSPTHRKRGPISLNLLEREAIALLRKHLEFTLRDLMPEMPDGFNRESDMQQMHIDAATLQALEIRTAFRPGGLVPTGSSSSAPASPISMKGTLLSTLSRTVTDSGHRLLKRTLSAPSTLLPEINSRLALVSAFVDREMLRTDLRDSLRQILDVMRVVQRFRVQRGEGTDVWAVARWIRDVEYLVGQIRTTIALETRGQKRAPSDQPAEGVDRLIELVESFVPMTDLADEIESAIDEAGLHSASMSSAEDGADPGDAMLAEPKSKAKKKEEDERRKEEEQERKKAERWWIKPSFSTELTDLFKRIGKLEKSLDELQARLRDELEAPNLSLDRNQRGAHVVTVKGKLQLGKIERSGSFHSVNESRSSKTFAYSEWTALGHKIDKALEELEMAKARALRRLRAMVIERADIIQQNAERIDEIDLTTGFAQAAVELGLTRPVLNEGTDLKIVNGRHPSVEMGLLGAGRMFTPNTTEMTSSSHLHVITGPNQGGKSTLLRQTAVISILAQSGSFIPAEYAEIGLVDRVFSRVGARDDLFRDRSTFMLEMVETAAILKYATPRSLVIMDEIGRGTTLDAGVSIAYATLDHILQNIRCRTLFATHYHELARMLGVPHHTGSGSVQRILPDDPALRPGVAFFCTDITEMGDSFAYSYKLRSGINYDSHAIKAAQLAGMPPSFLETAQKTLDQLQGRHKPTS